MAQELLTRSLFGKAIRSGCQVPSIPIRQRRRPLSALPRRLRFKHDPASLTYRTFSNANPAAAKLDSFDESTRFEYLTPLPLYEVERPFQLLRPIGEESEDRSGNCQWDAASIETITDVRGLGFEPTLDQHGFIVRRSPTILTSEQFDNKDMAETFYMPEMYDLLKREVQDADLVVGFHHQTRKLADGDPLGSHPHVDVSPRYLAEQLQNRFGAATKRLLDGRIRVFNTWRPTFDSPIEDYPLALADGQSINENSFIECTHVHPDDQETYNLYYPYSAQLRWYYLSRQTRDEVLIFKNFDSATVPAKTCVHAAFRHSQVPPEVRPRESIEARFFVFTYTKNCAENLQ